MNDNILDFLTQLRMLEAVPYLRSGAPNGSYLSQAPFGDSIPASSDYMSAYEERLAGEPSPKKKIPFGQIPEDINAYSYYIPDFLLANTPYQYPARYRESLAAYAGRPSVTNPMAEIQDIFLNPLNYGVYQPPNPVKKGESGMDIAKKAIIGAGSMGMALPFLL